MGFSFCVHFVQRLYLQSCSPKTWNMVNKMLLWSWHHTFTFTISLFLKSAKLITFFSVGHRNKPQLHQWQRKQKTKRRACRQFSDPPPLEIPIIFTCPHLYGLAAFVLTERSQTCLLRCAKHFSLAQRSPGFSTCSPECRLT